jgi:predicted secreted Zn-dependent protease
VKPVLYWLLSCGGKRIALFLLAFAPHSVAEVGDGGTVHESATYYEVSGNTAQQLRYALNRSGPATANGRRYDGLTVWSVTWYPEFRSSGDRCELAAFKTSVDIAITLPRWTDDSRASSDLIEQWDKYSRALAAHERGHVEIALAAAAEMRERVGNLPARAGCAELEKDVAAAVLAVRKKARKEERRYDKKTRHGKKTGARFP